MTTISYWQAWEQWADGTLDKTALLGPMTIIWWARIGKVVGFLAVATLVLDVLGAERVDELVRGGPPPPPPIVGPFTEQDKAERRFSAFSAPWAVRVSVALTALIFAALYTSSLRLESIPSALYYLSLAVAVGFAVVPSLIMGSLRLIVFLLREVHGGVPSQITRIIALIVTLAGFHFDLLAS